MEKLQVVEEVLKGIDATEERKELAIRIVEYMMKEALERMIELGERI